VVPDANQATIARVALLCAGQFCSIDLTQSIRPNVLRRVPVGTRR
jgi:hypothetical protein